MSGDNSNLFFFCRSSSRLLTSPPKPVVVRTLLLLPIPPFRVRRRAKPVISDRYGTVAISCSFENLPLRSPIAATPVSSDFLDHTHHRLFSLDHHTHTDSPSGEWRMNQKRASLGRKYPSKSWRRVHFSFLFCSFLSREESFCFRPRRLSES